MFLIFVLFSALLDFLFALKAEFLLLLNCQAHGLGVGEKFLKIQNSSLVLGSNPDP